MAEEGASRGVPDCTGTLVWPRPVGILGRSCLGDAGRACPDGADGRGGLRAQTGTRLGILGASIIGVGGATYCICGGAYYGQFVGGGRNYV